MREENKKAREVKGPDRRMRRKDKRDKRDKRDKSGK